MGEATVTSDEWVMLSWFYEIAWGDSSLPELRSLAANERKKLPRLQLSLLSLVDRGCLTIKRTNDARSGERQLEPEEARRVVKDADSWTVPGEPGFEGGADFFVAVTTDRADRLYRAEREAGRLSLAFEAINYV